MFLSLVRFIRENTRKLNDFVNAILLVKLSPRQRHLSNRPVRAGGFAILRVG